MSALEQSDTTVRSNGAPPEQAGRIAVQNPATGEVIGQVDDMSPEQVEAAVERARRAQPAWEALGFEGRGEVMYELRRWLVENRERVLDVLVKENGKTREDALLAEMFYVCDALGFWAKNARKYLADEKVKTHSPLLLGKKVVVRYRPQGVVGVIGPWNYPLTNSFGDCIPALMAGNSVVLKPSEVTPLTNLLMGEAALECGAPADVFTVVTGAGRTGAALVDNVDMIHFTGSTATGRKVAVQAAERLIPVSLELGGKDPMIVLRDADVDRAANMAVEWAFRNSGQICISVERVYVEEPVYDAFVQKVVEKTRTLRQGAPGAAGRMRRGRDDQPAADRHRAQPRAGRDRQGRRGAGGRQGGQRPGAVLRADGPHRRRPHDEDHDRGDLRPDAADHEGARRGRGSAARERQPLRAELQRLLEGRRQGRGGGPPARGRQRLRERRADELPGDRGALRRLQRVRVWAPGTAHPVSASTAARRRS